MEQGAGTYLKLLEDRLVVLRQLAVELDQAIEAVAVMNGDALDGQLRRQEQLCAGLRLLNEQLRELSARSGEPLNGNLPQALSGSMRPDAARRRTLQRETALAEALLRRRNRVYAGLLDRSRQSVQTMMNVMVGFAATYEPHKNGPVFG